MAMTRELVESRVLVLPVLIDDAELPKFLRGKVFAKLRGAKHFQADLVLTPQYRTRPLQRTFPKATCT